MYFCRHKVIQYCSLDNKGAGDNDDKEGDCQRQRQEQGQRRIIGITTRKKTV